MYHCSRGKLIYNTSTSNTGKDVLCNKQAENVVTWWSLVLSV